MKYKLLRLSTFFTAGLLLLVLAGCVKNNDATFTDFTKVSDLVILRNGGLSGFKASNINVDPTSSTKLVIDITAELASVQASASDITVTLGVDDAKRTAYNAANGTAFQAMAANKYKIVSTSLKIAAGNHYVQTTLEIYQDQFDPTVSFMLPISITDASGKGLSSNQNTLYFNVIGNPIAGNYTEEWIRWASTDTSGAPAFHFTGDDNVFSAESPTQVFVESVDNGADFHISFTNTAGVLSNFQVTLDQASWPNFGATVITTAPVFIRVDPVKGIYRFFFQYQLSTGAPRSIVEEFVKQ